MNETPPIELSCPTCQTKIIWDERYPFRPFCSERCKLIDLGEWANENHRIAGEDTHAKNDEL
ncbi:DNA gyrase inhibitor YacG [Gilvimarinus sp. SDUM040013]|uniref:DNA gyrase inhibitor YacG n=1 Tax=Gilvimarinus gilvus TaxID=3058038 RepID=A0ABU4RSS1_9GAMM|nr:DNA gyrase inhibitor YacG [Gilvimarinus sp. SDUM040013]MDO3388380.1 DNA gyrase inhibitor YacG [Gilvimarinus sp. SDUM040013]MDX6847930.1 DNA gyrase inhibitor YacG [Gilvimarinus sp. SDUM040013]